MGLIPKKLITGRREPRATTVDGVVVPNVDPTPEFTINGSIQPANSRDLKSLPEGTHYKTVYKIYTKNYTPEGDESEVDEFFVKGQWLKLIRLDNWKNDLINHNKIIVGS